MKKYVLLVLSSVGLFVALSPLSSYSFFRLVGFAGQPIKAGLAILTYCALTYYWLNQKQTMQWKIIVGISALLPVLIGYLPMYIRDFDGMRVALPSTIAHVAGVFFGYVMSNATQQFKLGMSLVLIPSALWVSTQGYELWMHKLHFDSYSGSNNEKLPNFSLRDERGSVVNIASLKGKFVVLDFWNTGCGACFQKFPLLEQYHERYLTNASVKFYAVNIPLSRDKPRDANNIIKKKSYKFPVLYAAERSLATLFKVRVYPTVVVIDPLNELSTGEN